MFQVFISVLSFYFNLRTLTGENWNNIMHDCMITPPFCEEAKGNCGWPLGAPVYWVSFQIMSGFLFVNVIVAVVLQLFEV